jgi:hypothetical protein
MFMKDTGSVERYYRKNVSEERNSIIGVSAGLGIEIVRTPVYRLSLSTLPSYAYILKKITGSDTSDFEKPEYGNNKNLLGFISTKTSGSYETAIKGSAYGFDISMDNRIFVKKAISVDLQIGVQSLFAPSLSGKTKYRHRSATSTLMSGNVVIDTSWTDYATALKGNVYGTGDIVFYDDPDAIDFEAKRTAVEFSTVYIRFGLSFYF